MNRSKAKLFIILFSAFCVLQIGTTVSKAAVRSNGDIYFRFVIRDTAHGETYGIAGRKVAGISHSRVTQDRNSLGQSVPTNYIIIASNGVQISDNEIIDDYYTSYIRYYSAAHVGQVYLRANSGSEIVGYNVSGTWEPNDYGFCCGCF